MTTKHFRIREHTVDSQYIREYPNATRDQNDIRLKLAVKQYTPLDEALANVDGAVTVIAAQGNGFPKVCRAFSALAACSPVV